MEFNITHWHAISPGLNTIGEWQSWFNGTVPETAKVPAQSIPPMMRRRMSDLSKIALQTAITLKQHHSSDFDYLIFSSRHGELPRTVDILQQVLQGEEASPMAFSQSVHNTCSGLFTIATQSPIPATSLAGCESSLHSAFIEAYSYLTENPDHSVLVIDFDAPLPTPYENSDPSPTPPLYALGLVLTSGSQYQLSYQAKPSVKGKIDRHNQTLEIIEHMINNQNCWQVEDSRHIWSWQCSQSTQPQNAFIERIDGDGK